jgi:hypothetical protein
MVAPNLAGAATELSKASVQQPRKLTIDVGLLAHQNENPGEYGKYRHNHTQAVEKHRRNKCYHTRDDKPDAQQQHPYVLCEIHGGIPFLNILIVNAFV